MTLEPSVLAIFALWNIFKALLSAAIAGTTVLAEEGEWKILLL